MTKGKKVLAITLATTMAFSCLTACGSKKGGNNEAKPTPTAIIEDLVKVDPELGITAPDEVENNADAQKVSLKVWAPAEEQDLMEKLCTTFDKAHAEYDIDFTYEVSSEADAANNLTNDPQSAADVFMFAGDQLSNLADGNLLFDLSALIPDNPEIEEKYDDQAYNSCLIDGKLLAFPFTANQFFMYYNKSMLTEEEVKSLDDILAKDLGTAPSGEKVKNFGFDLANGWYILAFMYGNGCTLYGDGTQEKECNWNNEDGKAVVKYLNNMIATGKFFSNANDDGLPLLEKGELATVVTGSWNSNAVKAKLGDNYAACVLPTFKIDGKECHMKPFADFKMIGVNAFAGEPRPAAELAYFLADNYSQWQRLQIRSYAPTVKILQDYVTDDTKEKPEPIDPAVIAATEQMSAENSSLRPTTPQLKNYWSFGQNLGSLIYKQDERITDESKMQDTLDLIVKGITTVL
ncbi:MAG: extracellular solute-binding protein [Lachnospiraceae bacterium]|nr:extracellular solute-binding protein [Lachnospiraceae bacterium]